MCAILPTGASSAFTSWHNRLSAKIRHDLFFQVIQVQSSPHPPCSTHSPPHTISKTHSKHIVPSGGFAQPTLSLMLRREDLRNPSQHVGLSTSDRVLVGSRQLSPRACPRQYSWPALGRAKEGQPRLANEAAAIDKDLVTCDDGRLLRKEPDRPFDGRQQRASRFPVVPKRDTQTAASIAVVDPITRKIAG